MSKAIVICFILPLFLFFAWSETGGGTTAAQKQSSPNNQTVNGTLQKMIVENGSVSMNLDLNGLNGSNDLTIRQITLQFAAAADSFFPIVVLNDQLRGAEPGSIALVPQARLNPLLPAAVAASLKQLAVEKLPSDAGFDLAVRDGKTGFTFFNVQGHQYDYDPDAESLSTTGGNLLISQEFANALGRPSDAGAMVGTISIGATMQPIEVRTIVNGDTQSAIVPPLRGLLRRGEAQAGESGAETPRLVAGPDVIVGDLPEMAQYGRSTGFVGLGIATTSCNNGDQPLHWFALPNTDHPVIPQNFYRMSGGADNSDTFEQIGQSWLKHAFAALEGNACSFGCNTSGCTTGSNLCTGCSDPYDSSLNASQSGLGSRAWVNPFTGEYPSGANNHNGHNHTGTSH